MPPVLVMAYVLLANGDLGGDGWDRLILVGALLAAGLISIWAGPWHRHAKIAASVGYPPLMAIVLLWVTLVADCSVRSCL